MIRRSWATQTEISQRIQKIVAATNELAIALSQVNAAR